MVMKKCWSCEKLFRFDPADAMGDVCEDCLNTPGFLSQPPDIITCGHCGADNYKTNYECETCGYEFTFST